MVRREDFAAEKGDSLNGTGGGISSVECGDVGESDSIVDVDFVSGGDVEVSTVNGEMRDWELERGDVELRKSDGEGIGGGGEFLKRWNGR